MTALPVHAPAAPVAVGDWRPARYTRPLSGCEQFPSHADKLLPFVRRHWRSPEADTFELDEWQQWLIRHILELYPDDWPVVELRGQLRYRQVMISLGRQNGKSVIGAILCLYFLARHVRGPRVVSLASIESQAKIVYDRTFYAVDNNPTLRASLHATRTRGISRRDGTGIYKTMPAKEDTAQGEPITGCLYDELHLGNLALWEAIILGQSAKINSLMVGITTAGDDDSELLIKLYSDADAALDGEDERFGVFVWEAADATLTEANVIAANPAVACGRVPLATKMADARKTWKAGPDKTGVPGKDRVIRYTLNRFVRGSASTWAPLDLWDALAGDGLDDDAAELVFGLDRHEWEFATITASTKINGRVQTEIVASLVDTSHDELVNLCVALHAHARNAAYAMDATLLGSVGKALRLRGFEVYLLGSIEMQQAAASTLALIKNNALTHAGDPLLAHQMPHAKRRDMGDTWRISRALSTGPIDAVIATVTSAFIAETRADLAGQMF